MSRAGIFNKKPVVEALGFLLVGFGLYLGMSLVCHGLGDNGLVSESIRNLGGPLGARIARPVLQLFGVVGLAFPLAMVLLGPVLALGFRVWPGPRTLLAFLVLTVALAGLVHLTSPLPETFRLVHGPGGRLGLWIGNGLRATVGYGGGLIALTVVVVVTLVMSGKFTASKLSEAVEYLVYFVRRSFADSLMRSAPVPVSKLEEASSLEGRSADKSGRGQEERTEVLAAGFLDFTSAVPRNRKPDPSIFRHAELITKNGNDAERISAQLVRELKEFKVEGTVTSVTDGPIVTTYEFEPAPGTKLSKLVGLGEDLARLLKAKSLRVIAPIPGKDTVGLEIPNRERRTIGFRNVIAACNSRERTLPIAMGVDTFGNPVIEDLADMPHLLIAGSTGSGKSVFLNSLVASLVCKKTAKEMRLVMIDPKMVEFAAYGALPHLACEVITDINEQGKQVLDRLVDEMEERYRLFRAVGAKHLAGFNKIIRTKKRTRFPRFEGKWQTLPHVVAIIEEFADFILLLGKEAETAITRLAQKARAAGIHLVIATQRPSANVVTGLIKANFPTRVAFRVLSGVDSRTILDQNGAETLLGKGDMLYLSATGLQRIHAAYLEEDEIARMVKSC